MLQFWKRSGHKEKAGSSSPTKTTPPFSPCMENGMDDVLNNLNSSGILASLEDEGLCDIGDVDATYLQSSRLSKTLLEVLTDKGALGYFIQYLDSQAGLSYVRCWLDIESFRSAAQSSDGLCLHNITRDQLDEHIDVRLLSPLPSSRVDHDSLSVSTDCDSYTADSNSLYDFSSSNVPTNEVRSSSAIDNNKSRNDNSIFCDKDISDTSTSRLHKLDIKNTNSTIGKSSPSPVNNSDKDATVDCAQTFSNDKFTHKRKEKICRAFTDDALRIFKKYVAQEAPNPVHCTDEIRNDIIESICTENGVLDPACYDKLQKFVYDILEQKYFHNYTRSHYNCKYQIDILTSGNVLLQDILYNEAILFYFMEFLEQENNSALLLEFWLAATNFRQQLLLSENTVMDDRTEAQNDAIILYDKYFSLQATCRLGFCDKIRFQIEENICSDNGPQPDCFQQPVRLIEYVLEKNYLKSFLTSQLYFKYLSELISTVQANGCVSGKNTQLIKSQRTLSDCSSEISNTLLAMDETVPLPVRKSIRAPNKTDMNIDTRQLYDPDSLWKRTKTRRLSFGRITDLGRFETDVEPEPDRKKSESRFSRAMNRLLYNNTDTKKTEEEMAWQVAEMIVKDVTSITLGEISNSNQS